MSDSWTGVSISSRSGHLSTLPVRPSWSACSHGVTEAVRSVASRTTCSAGLPDLSEIDVVGPHLVAGDVDAAAVDLEVAVADELAGLRARGGEAEAVDDVVEARLEHPQQRPRR